VPLTVSHGKKHDYLGMHLDFTRPGKVTISMFDYIKNMLNELPKDMAVSANTPTAENLFMVRDEKSCKCLNKDKKELFHHNTAKLLFLVQHM
jgi:hypothetical protein